MPETTPTPLSDSTLADTDGALSRRTALGVAGLAGAALVVSACSSISSTSTPSNTATTGGSGGGGTVLGAAADVPVGGGVVYEAQKVVVTQPKAGEYKGFSAVCTHQGCLIGGVQNGAMICPCHMSFFSIDNGDVLQGPAPTALPTVNVTVTGGNVVLNA